MTATNSNRPPEESRSPQDVFNLRLRNLREKVVDRAVCGAEEMVELIDAMLVVSTGESGEPVVDIPPPPDGSIGGQMVG